MERIEREISTKLEEWFLDRHRKPLLISGARQVGKTTLIKDIFAPMHFEKENIVYVDFRADRDERVFIKNNINVKRVIEYLSIKRGVDINEKTLLIFDEVQECIQTLTLLKYFNQDYPEIPIIVTGSLVRTKLKQMQASNHFELDPEISKDNQDGHNNFMYPVGKITELDLYPCNFNEYCKARNKKLFTYLKEAFENKVSITKEYHDMALKYLNEYLVIGGLPENIMVYLETSSFEKSRRNLINIYNNYLNDMVLYQISDATIIRTKRLFDNIYTQLNKENKNFKFTDIEKDKRYRDYDYPLGWLLNARIVYQSHQLKQRVELPLIEDEESLFRTYLMDVGLFAFQSGLSGDNFIDEIKVSSLSGIFYENLVACELVCRGYKLFYWKGKSSSELEFLLPYNDEVIPIDAKKNRGNLNSLAKYRENNKNNIAIKISSNMYGFDKKQGLYTIPYYFLGFFIDALKNGDV